MPKILKDAGFTNYFFHGGSRGTMGFESYTLASGFDRYFSREDYPDKNHYDGTWGIYDEPFMNFAADEINKMPQPFMAGIFSLSSHQPYSVPLEHQGKFPKGTLEIHESVGYADFALRSFFEKIQHEAWFNNTIFFITADHTSKLASKKFKNLVGHYRVPLVVYSPEETLDLNAKRVTQHSDIPRTIVEIQGLSAEKLPATSVSLKSTDEGVALNYADGGQYLLISDKEVLSLNKSASKKSYSYDWNTGELKAAATSKNPLLKAYLQYFVNGLINNNLSIYR